MEVLDPHGVSLLADDAALIAKPTEEEMALVEGKDDSSHLEVFTPQPL